MIPRRPGVGVSTALAAALLAVAVSFAGCGAGHAEARGDAHALRVSDDTAWVRDIVDTSHDLTVALRPNKLSHDPIYGPLVRKASRMAAGESRSSYLGSTTLSAMQQSDELLLAVRSSQPLDAVLIVSGVPANVDVERVLDDSGQSPWKSSSRTPNGLLALVSRESEPPGTLYVVGERTWVLGIGGGAERVRERLVEQSGRAPLRPPASLWPPPLAGSAAADSPLSIRLQGELLERLRGVARSGLRPIFDRLLDVRLVLASGQQGNVVAIFDYDEDKAAERAGGRAEELMAIVPEKISPRLAFLRSATVQRAGRSVQVTAKLPPDVLRSLANAEND